jgi:hypothetical protein
MIITDLRSCSLLYSLLPGTYEERGLLVAREKLMDTQYKAKQCIFALDPVLVAS